MRPILSVIILHGIAKPENHQDSPEEPGGGMGRLSFHIKIKHITIKL